MNFNFKYFRKHLFVLLFFISCHIFAQTISPTNGLPAGNGTVPCSSCVPIGWTNNGGTPDISNTTFAATTGTSGGGANWTSTTSSTDNLTLPLPPNSHTTWLSLRDLGPPPALEESVNTTIGGLTVGRTYEVVVYSLTAVTRNNGNGGKYAGSYNAQFSAAVAGQTLTAGNLTQNTWGTSRLRFTATQTSHVMIVRPGADAAVGGNNSYETVQVSVTVNAVNAVPIAVADNVTTNQNTPVTINVFTNDSDPDGSVVANTVRFANNQTSVVVPNQGTWSVNTTNGVVTFTPLPTFVGTATIPYTIKDNFVLDGISNPSTSNPANISVTVVANIDTDGDGIPDNIDLDSDNDGILDIDECTESVVNQPFSSTDGTTVSFSAPAADLGFIFDVYTLDNSFNLNINGVSLATNEIQFQSNQTDNIRFVDGSRYGIGGVPEIYAMTGTATNPLIRIVIQKNGSINLYGSKSSNGPLFPLELYGGNSLNIITWNQTGSNSIVLSQIVVGATHITGNGNGVKSGFCDPDGDGISNQFDLDSDGDGCFDALEGDENVTLNQLNANGSINTTANGGVNSNGVPNLVNIGGAADIGGDIGQGIGDSQNALINACYCYKKPVLNAGVTVPARHGITALNRASSRATDWPIVRQSAWTVLEARTKGFVVNRVAFSDADANPATPMTPIGIDAADFVEGMMVYDTTNNCLKIYNGTVWNCYTTQACPQ